MAKNTVLTLEGKQSLEKELDTLKSVKRIEIADKIKQARAFGDLSENSEYDEAKNNQAVVEARINELEEILKHCTVLEKEALKLDAVSIGCKVTVYDEKYKEEDSYTIVGTAEADPDQMKISDESAIGKALMGRRAGDTVMVQTRTGEISLKIVAINLPD